MLDELDDDYLRKIETSAKRKAVMDNVYYKKVPQHISLLEKSIREIKGEIEDLDNRIQNMI